LATPSPHLHPARASWLLRWILRRPTERDDPASPRPERKGAIIAVSNLLSFIGVSSRDWRLLRLYALLASHAAQDLLPQRLFALAATIYVVALLPQALFRLMLLFATHTIYRIRVDGRDNIPDRGGALFVSITSRLWTLCCLPHPPSGNVRFIMFQDIYDSPFIKPFAKLMKAIPISSNLRPRDMIRSLRIASDSIREGRVVCIFAEGQITRIGHMLPFRRAWSAS